MLALKHETKLAYAWVQTYTKFQSHQEEGNQGISHDGPKVHMTWLDLDDFFFGPESKLCKVAGPKLDTWL